MGRNAVFLIYTAGIVALLVCATPKTDEEYEQFGGIKEYAFKESCKVIRQIKEHAAKKYNKIFIGSDDCKENCIDDIRLHPGMARLFERSAKRKRSMVLLDAGWAIHWPLPIGYKISPSYDDDSIAMIERAISEWESRTCLKFMYHPFDYDFAGVAHLVFIYSNGSCSSYVGLVPEDFRLLDGGQPIYLSPGCTRFIGIILHEIGHAVGLIHEHQRRDRDDFVTAHEENLAPGWMANILMLDEAEYNVNQYPYDMSSVMHYSSKSFLDNAGVADDLYSILPNNLEYLKNLGQRGMPSFFDVISVKGEYCGGPCNMSPTSTCNNRGFENPDQGCSGCLCADGFSGDACELVDTTICHSTCTQPCGPIEVTSTSWNFLETTGTYPEETKCIWHLTAASGQSIEVQFDPGAQFSMVCGHPTGDAGDGLSCYHYVELKLNNMAETGPRYCCQLTNNNIWTGTEIAVIMDTTFPLDLLPDTYIPYYPNMTAGFRLRYRLAAGPPSCSGFGGTCLKKKDSDTCTEIWDDTLCGGGQGCCYGAPTTPTPTTPSPTTPAPTTPASTTPSPTTDPPTTDPPTTDPPTTDPPTSCSGLGGTCLKKKDSGTCTGTWDGTLCGGGQGCCLP